MSFISEIRIGMWYGWWFPAAYALLTVSVVIVYGKGFTRRFFRFPASKSLKQKALVVFSAALFGRALMVFSAFVPLSPGAPWFWAGISVFVVGAVLTLIAMINFATTPYDRPVTKGLYRASRHPVQLLAIIMWLGVAMATESWFLAGACLLLAGLTVPSVRAQEHSCIEMYGDAYREYMESTPRFLSPELVARAVTFRVS